MLKKNSENDTGWHNAGARPILRALRPVQLTGVPCIRVAASAVSPRESIRVGRAEGTAEEQK